MASTGPPPRARGTGPAAAGPALSMQPGVGGYKKEGPSGRTADGGSLDGATPYPVPSLGCHRQAASGVAPPALCQGVPPPPPFRPAFPLIIVPTRPTNRYHALGRCPGAVCDDGGCRRGCRSGHPPSAPQRWLPRSQAGTTALDARRPRRCHLPPHGPVGGPVHRLLRLRLWDGHARDAHAGHDGGGIRRVHLPTPSLRGA